MAAYRICDCACGNQVIGGNRSVRAGANDQDIVAERKRAFGDCRAVNHCADEHILRRRRAMDGGCAVGSADHHRFALHIFRGIFRGGIAQVEIRQLNAAAFPGKHAIPDAEAACNGCRFAGIDRRDHAFRAVLHRHGDAACGTEHVHNNDRAA